MVRRDELTDQAWQALQPPLLVAPRRKGPTASQVRQAVAQLGAALTRSG